MSVTDAPDATHALPADPRRRRRLWRALLGAAVCLAVLVAVPIAAGGFAVYSLSHRLDRVEGAFTGLPDRPPPSTPRPGVTYAPMNILVLGTDRRSPVPTTGSTAAAPAWVYGAQRTDTMMVVHVAGDRRSVSVVSLPRDTWVPIPDHGEAKINAAYSWGGPRLTVATVERLTGVRIDHLLLVDWAGFAALTDAVGGVDLDRGSGPARLDGEEALAYVGQRYGLPGGDLDRMRRQHAFLRALARQTLDAGLLQDPAESYQLLGTLAEHAAVDAEWSVREMGDLLWSLRHVRADDVEYLTLPLAGPGREGEQSVLRLDRAASDSLWRAARRDELGAWTEEHAYVLTPEAIR